MPSSANNKSAPNGHSAQGAWVTLLVAATGIASGHRCPGFLEEFGKLAAAGRRELVDLPLFANMTWRLMLESGNANTTATERFDVFVGDMVGAGLAGSRPAAALLLWNRLCSVRPGNIDDAVALQFVRAVASAGVGLQLDAPGSAAPQSQGLARAVHVHQTEVAMKQVLTAASSCNMDTAGGTAVQARHRRVGL